MSLFENEPTRVARPEELPPALLAKTYKASTLRVPPHVDMIGNATREIRSQREGLPDEEWVRRILRECQESSIIPDGYIWNQHLQAEIVTIPPEGVHKQREQDQPPPPIFSETGEMVVPRRLYAGGLVWNVGEMLGEGGFGKVFDVRHLGGEQRPRLVKFVAVDQAIEDAKERRGMLWNEVGAAMATGDYVNDETVFDEDGNMWTAIVLERHDGKTMADIIKEDRKSPEKREKKGTVGWAYKQAMVLRSVISVLRRMHANGWTHRDIKPGNIIANLTDKEESLSRPIDFGGAQKEGVIRRKSSNLLQGSPSYLLPEAWFHQEIDLRLRDYWAAVLSVSLAVKLFDFQRISDLSKLHERLSTGSQIQAPELSDLYSANAYFSEHNITGAQRAFFEWLYRFIQPHLGIQARQEKWRHLGITQTLDIPSIDYANVDLFPGEEYVHATQGDFLDDDAFVNELEDHIRALADQAGIEMPKGVLENLREFPAEQMLEERILNAVVIQQ